MAMVSANIAYDDDIASIANEAVPYKLPVNEVASTCPI